MLHCRTPYDSEVRINSKCDLIQPVKLHAKI